MTAATTTPTQRADLAAAMVPTASRLAGAVHGIDPPQTIAEILNDLDRQQLYAVAVVLAAMVDVDRTPAELLSWVTWQWGGLEAAS